MIASNLFLRVFCLSISGFITGCSFQDQISQSQFLVPKKQAFKTDKESKSEQIVTLLVGLKPYLGKGTSEIKSSPELYLQSAGKPLLLKDSLGIENKSADIYLSWRKVPLLVPKKLSRQVVGPFSSFESAQLMVERLRSKGISAVIANPQDWEVWISDDVNVPKEINALAWKQIITSEIRPVLRKATGDILLTGPLKIEAPEGLYFNGGLYLGPFWLKADAYGSWTFIEEVPLQRYLQGVVPHEIGSNAPQQALEAQAVLARTWALANRERFAIDGYHLCSDTQCQVYKDPQKASQIVRGAIANSAGRYLSWNKKPIHAVYHASNGGVMASGTEAWSISPLPYLRAQLDGSNKWRESFILPLQKKSAVQNLLRQVDGAYGNTHPRFRWVRFFDSEELKNALDLFASSDALPTRVKVLERGVSGRVLALEIFDEEQQLRRVLKLDEIRRVLRNLPSTLFVVEKLKDDMWKFSGGGFGHGAGLSQAGAIDLARRGWNTSKILRHYYPGTRYRTLQDLPKAP